MLLVAAREQTKSRRGLISRGRGEKRCHPGVVGGALRQVKWVEWGQVFEAPEVVMKLMVLVS